MKKSSTLSKEMFRFICISECLILIKHLNYQLLTINYYSNRFIRRSNKRNKGRT